MSEYTQRGTHPDADLLSSFAEDALPEHERLTCMDHLAACAQCREIVYLIQPDMAEDPAPVPVKPPAAVPFWKRWVLPATVVAAIAVATIAVISITATRHQKPPVAPGPELIAKVEEPPRMDATVPAPRPAVAPAPAKKRAERSESPSVTQMQFDGNGVVPTTPQSAPQQSAGVQPAAPPPPPAAPARSAPVQPSEAAALSGRGLAPMTFAAPAAKPAPSELAGVTGKVTDPAGAAVPRAQVNLTDAGKSKTFTSATDGSGQYSVNGVPPGRYRLSIQSPGFKSSENEIDLQPLQIAKADSVLAIGSVSDTVMVTAEVAAVQTSTTARPNAPAPPLPPRAGRGSAVTFASGVAGAGNGVAGAGSGITVDGIVSAGIAVTPELPSKKPAATTVANGNIMLAADSDGTLFLRASSGKTWKAVKGKWKGKVVRLISSTDAPGANDAIFQLSTDSGDVWISRDGSHWNPAPKR